MKIMFYILAAWCITGGILAITMRNLVHCAIALIAFFAGIAGIFFCLSAEFLGATQMIVYVGAIAVLILFAIMLTRGAADFEKVSPFSRGAIWGCLAGLGVLAVLIRVIQTLPAQAAQTTAANLSISTIGEVLMKRYLIPFEVISILLTAALVGAVVMALDEPKNKPHKH